MPRFRKEKERVKETCNGFKLTTLYHWSILPITQDKKHSLLRISKPVFFVLHPQKSLKKIYCVNGNSRLLSFKENHPKHMQMGKINLAPNPFLCICLQGSCKEVSDIR